MPGGILPTVPDSHPGATSKDVCMYVCMCLKDSYKKRGKGRDLQFTGSLSKWPHWLRLGQFQAKSFICVFHVGAGAQVLGSSSAAFPSTSVGSWIRGRDAGDMSWCLSVMTASQVVGLFAVQL